MVKLNKVTGPIPLDEGVNTIESGKTYTIANKVQLECLATLVNEEGQTCEGATIQLLADIALNDTTGWENWDENTTGLNEWTAIGTYQSSDNMNPFKGTFNGGGYSISGIYINKPTQDYQGLFGYVDGGSIQNLSVTESYMNGKRYIAGIVGYLVTGKIANCSNAGNINAYDTDVGENYAGGIIGSCFVSEISNCFNVGSIGANKYAGGIAGCVSNKTTVTNCYNAGSVSADDAFVGGIAAGVSSSSIKNCYNEGSVSAIGAVGGVVGKLASNTVENCYNAGTVTGSKSNWNIGGVAGMVSSGTLKNCYNIGTVNGSNNRTGSVAGGNYSGTVSNCFYDKQMCTVGGISSYDCTGQAEGKLTSELVGDGLKDATASNPWGTDNWAYEDGMYPRLNGMDTTDAAIVSATPVFLSDEETVDEVTQNFTLGIKNNVAWKSSDSDVIAISVNDANATVTQASTAKEVTVTVSRNDNSRRDILLKVPQGVFAPTVTTANVTDIARNSATIGGEVTSNGGDTVTERGVLYSATEATPTIGASDVTKVSVGSEKGQFSKIESGLSTETKYYVRAYAINSQGTAYGEVKTFTTAANQKPTVSDLPFNINATEDTMCNAGLSKVTFQDADGDDITVVLQADTGTFTVQANQGVTVNGSGTKTLTLSGTVSGINTQLASIKYQGAENLYGAGVDSFAVTANDGTGATGLGSVNVTIVGINDAPTLSATAANPTFTENGNAVSLFSETEITNEEGQLLTKLMLTVSPVKNGADESLQLDGSDVVLTDGSTGTTASNEMEYSVVVEENNHTATITLTKASGMTSAEMKALVDAIAYQNSSENPSDDDRVVTITSLQDNGGTTNEGVNTATLSQASTVSLTA